MLSEAEMLGCKLVDAPMDPNSKLMPYQRESLHDPKIHEISGKSELLSSYSTGNYLFYVVSYGQSLDISLIIMILKYCDECCTKRFVIFWLWTLLDTWFFGSWLEWLTFCGWSIMEYCVFVRGSLVFWKINKKCLWRLSAGDIEFRSKLIHEELEYLFQIHNFSHKHLVNN